MLLRFWLLVLVSVVCVPPALAQSGGAAPAPALVVQKTAGKWLVGATADHKLMVYLTEDGAAPVKVSERQLAGPVVALSVVDGRIFVTLARTEVAGFQLSEAGQLGDLLATAPVVDGGAAPAPAAGPAPIAPAPAADKAVVIGKVAKVERGTVLLELNEASAVRPGDALLVRSQHRETKMNLFSGVEEEVVSNAATAVLEVRQVEGKRAVAELARGDEAANGDTLERTERQPRSTTWYAPRAGYRHWARATIRPFPNTGSIDFGSLTDLAYGYYWEFLHFQARVAPFGISVPHSVKAYNIHGLVSYQNDIAEFGIGGGYFNNQFEGRYEYECTSSGFSAITGSDASGTTSPRFTCKQAGPTFVQHLRLGSMDGMNFKITNSLAVNGGQFRFGYLEGSFDVPVSRTLNLYAAGGGSTGIKWGEAGMRTYLRGVGGHDTLILSTGIGGTSMRAAAIFGGKDVKTDVGNGVLVSDYQDGETTVGGLHIAVGLEWRQ